MDKFKFVVLELELLLVVLASSAGASMLNRLMSAVLVSCICRLFFSLMMALSSELRVVLLFLEVLCSCMLLSARACHGAARVGVRVRVSRAGARRARRLCGAARLSRRAARDRPAPSPPRLSSRLTKALYFRQLFVQ